MVRAISTEMAVGLKGSLGHLHSLAASFPCAATAAGNDAWHLVCSLHRGQDLHRIVLIMQKFRTAVTGNDGHLPVIVG